MPNAPRATEGRGRLIAALFASLVICSLVAAGIVPIVADWTGGGSDPDPSTDLDPAVDQGEYESELRTAIAGDPSDAVAAISLARLLALRGATTEALPHFERAVSLDPDNATYRIDFGRALAEAGKPADAEVQYERALAIDPKSAEAYYWLGELYTTWEPPRREAAAEAYRQAIEAAPESVPARLAEEALRQGFGGVPGTPVSVNATPNGT